MRNGAHHPEQAERVGVIPSERLIPSERSESRDLPLASRDLHLTPLQTLQLGMQWFGEDAGGLNRVYAHLIDELAQTGVDIHGLVAGSAD
ncbi:MAG TPA: hypothetical protein VF488_01400, partial [Gemmatimonadaceae bacterium]